MTKVNGVFHNMEPLPEEVKKALNKEKYGWSKWGGPNMGLVQKNLTETWFCQACKEEQPSTLSPYMYEYQEREYIRLCSKCHNIRLTKEIAPLHFHALIKIVRP